MIDKRFQEGLRLFKEKKFFECHDVIEELWLETPAEDPYRDLYKGVIQAAAALYQLERKIFSGAVGLYRSSLVYLEKYKPSALGLDVQGLVDEMNKSFKDLGQEKEIK